MIYHVDKGPMLILDYILIKEKGSTDKSLAGEFRGESCGPYKHVYTGTGLEHEECNCLLYEQANYDDAPLDVRPVLGCCPKDKLEHDKTKHRDCAVFIVVHTLHQ
jgi:hypothetical protein